MRCSGLLAAVALLAAGVIQAGATATTTAVTVDPNPATSTASVALSATVRGESAIAGGTVTFRRGSLVIGSDSVTAETFTHFGLGTLHSCAVTTLGNVYCWGENSDGQVGTGSTSAEPVTTPFLVYDGGDATAVDGGATHSCMVAGGSLYCWGGNLVGQLGDGSTTDRTTPVEILDGDVTAVSITSDHTCAIQAGALKCWGHNASGQVGNGSTTDLATPQTIIASNVTAVAAGASHTCAILSGETTSNLRCWGSNDRGELGDGTTTNRYSPVVSDSGLVDAVTAGSEYTCARAGGQVACWGINTNGQLGAGNSTYGGINPATILENAAAVTAGYQQACVLMTDGSVKCWGRFAGGADYEDPETIIASGATLVAVGGDHACANVSGETRCWGSGDYGQLATGTHGVGNLYSTPTGIAFGIAHADIATTLPAASYQITASFGGHGSHAASTSAAETLTVTGDADTTAPVLTLPANIVRELPAGAASVTVTWTAPTASDGTDGSVTVTRTAGPASGQKLQAGLYTVSYEAEDSFGNVATGSFTIRVTGRTATGGSGNDMLVGSDSDDNLAGNGGDDTLDGRGGDDVMRGGPGDDTYVVDARGDVVVEKIGEGEDLVKASISYTLPNHVDNLQLTGTGPLTATGNDWSNKLTGNDAANGLNGLGGIDVLTGLGGPDRLSGGDNHDTASYETSPKAVTVDLSKGKGFNGDAQGDTLTGIEGLAGSRYNDRLTGDGKANRLAGLGGGDELVGGKDNDSFIYYETADSTPRAPDLILDFDSDEDDRIELAYIDANAKKPGDQSFTFIGKDAFSDTPGELRYARGLVEADTDGDGKADLAIRLKGAPALKKTSFVR